MNKTSVLHAPSYAHQGEFIAAATTYQFQVCQEGTTDATSAEGMTYLHNVHRLTPVASAAMAEDATAICYMAYKWPTEDDYYERNSLSAEYITTGEGVIGLQLVPGVRIQEYIGTDYTNASGVKMGALAPNPSTAWASMTRGTVLHLTNSGQFTDVATNTVARAQFIEAKGDWVTIEIIQAYRV